jgi:hypothetical protein
MTTLDKLITARKLRNRYYEHPNQVTIQPVIDEALKMSPRKAEALVEQEKREMGIQTGNNGCAAFIAMLVAALVVAAGMLS